MNALTIRMGPLTREVGLDTDAMHDTTTNQLGERILDECDRCEGRHLLIVTDTGAVCSRCFKEMKREGCFDNLLSFEREALGLPVGCGEWPDDGDT